MLYDGFIYACHVNSKVLLLHTYELIYLLPYYLTIEVTRAGATGFCVVILLRILAIVRFR